MFSGTGNNIPTNMIDYPLRLFVCTPFTKVDFYTGLVLRAIGIPLSLFTVLFAVARTVGWTAQWAEAASEPSLKISRPRQVGMVPPPTSMIISLEVELIMSSIAGTRRAAGCARGEFIHLKLVDSNSIHTVSRAERRRPAFYNIN